MGICNTCVDPEGPYLLIRLTCMDMHHLLRYWLHIYSFQVNFYEKKNLNFALIRTNSESLTNYKSLLSSHCQVLRPISDIFSSPSVSNFTVPIYCCSSTYFVLLLLIFFPIILPSVWRLHSSQT